MKIENGMSPYRKESYLNEQQRKSKFAPRIKCKGPHIRDFECLSRSCFFPDHANSDGTLRVEGISRKDLTERGFSIDRIKYTSNETVHDLIKKYLTAGPTRSFKYILSFNAGQIRSILDKDSYQAFVLIDDAPIKKMEGHALVLCAEKQKPSHVKELREKLARTINNPKDVALVYPE
ncbi:MAG: hypothetical protein KZQ77_13565 [Candidatus Thiodiazotropha sp. (ex Notomyrtea botanica)]|nr:hypothetical protein [Candidatus Thiodiazotropha sp. (ex Notomyrtea botanica)]